MKNLLLVLLISVAMLAVPVAFAKKKPQMVYDHTATMTYHSVKRRNLIEGRSDLYYAGEYTCTPGSERELPCAGQATTSAESVQASKPTNRVRLASSA